MTEPFTFLELQNQRIFWSLQRILELDPIVGILCFHFQSILFRFFYFQAEGQTVLHVAAQNGDENMIRTLYLARANATIQDLEGEKSQVFWNEPSIMKRGPTLVHVVSGWCHDGNTSSRATSEVKHLELNQSSDGQNFLRSGECCCRAI